MVQYFRRILGLDGSKECSGFPLSSSCRDESFTMGNGMYEKLTTISGYVCNRLFSIGEDGFRTRRIASVCKLFGGYKQSEREVFPSRDYLCTKNVEQEGR